MATPNPEKQNYTLGLVGFLVSGMILVFLGIVMGVAYMAFKPVELLRVPLTDNQTKAGTRYHFIGKQYSSKDVRSLAEEFSEDSAYMLEIKEEDVNSWMKFNTLPIAQRKFLGFKLDLPNFKIDEGKISVTIQIKGDFLGYEFPLIWREEGEVKKRGERYMFIPSKMYLGGAPLPFVKLFSAEYIPKFIGLIKEKEVADDFEEAWLDLSNVFIDGDELVLERR